MQPYFGCFILFVFVIVCANSENVHRMSIDTTATEDRQESQGVRPQVLVMEPKHCPKNKFWHVRAKRCVYKSCPRGDDERDPDTGKCLYANYNNGVGNGVRGASHGAGIQRTSHSSSSANSRRSFSSPKIIGRG